MTLLQNLIAAVLHSKSKSDLQSPNRNENRTHWVILAPLTSSTHLPSLGRSLHGIASECPVAFDPNNFPFLHPGSSYPDPLHRSSLFPTHAWLDPCRLMRRYLPHPTSQSSALLVPPSTEPWPAPCSRLCRYLPRYRLSSSMRVSQLRMSSSSFSLSGPPSKPKGSSCHKFTGHC